MDYLFEVMFTDVDTGSLQWMFWGVAAVICGLLGFLMYRIYGKFKLLQDINYGQHLYEAAEDSFREGNRDRYE